MRNNVRYKIILIFCVALAGIFVSCSNKKNTAVTRLYHDINTRYNVHFNANEAYNEALQTKRKKEEENLRFSDFLYSYPLHLDTANSNYRGQFTKTIDKTSKAIKLHSINRKPQIDRSRIQDKDYAAWIKNKEFNPFLVNTWALLADAYLEEEDYLQAIATLIYITKIYDNNPAVLSLARLKIARAYSEMGWTYEAENTLRKLEQEKLITPENEDLYLSIKSNLLIRKEEFKEAIPILEAAIKTEKNKELKRRKKYLLAQLYEQLGEQKQAYDIFSKIGGLFTPLNYDLNAGLKKIELSETSTSDKIKALEQFGKKSKYKDSEYKIYDIIGDIYLADKDTTNAIKNYSKSLMTNKIAAYEKAVIDIKLGEIYYDQKKYVLAQPLYAEALNNVKKDFKNYKEIATRSEVLDELAIYAKIIQEQDSLLSLVHLPEDERIKVIELHIKKLKEEEKRKEEQAQKLKHQMDQELNQLDNAWQNLDLVNAIASKYQPKDEKKYDFYFYNTQLIDQGKLAFQSVWGKRILEDNWRNKDKTLSFNFEDLQPENSEVSQQTDIPKAINKDIYSVEYYIQQLPMSQEAQQKANDMIDDAMFNLALVYRYLLDDSTLAISTFVGELTRYPNTPHKEEIYYQLFLVNLQLDNVSQYEYYRNLILSEYPESKYAKPLLENDYAWNFKYINKMQEELYQKTYDAYLKGDVNTIRKNFDAIHRKYPFASLMPKFAFLNALSYAQTKDIITLEKNLKQLKELYPQEDFIPLADAILQNIRNGMAILSDGAIIQSVDWSNAYVSSITDVAEGDSITNYFEISKDEPFVLMLAFGENTLDRNDLLYDVADFNFSNYFVQTFDLSFLNDSLNSSLVISKFENLEDIKSYIQKATDNGYLNQWNSKVIPIPVSQRIYRDILPIRGLAAYLDYYDKNLETMFTELADYNNLTLKDINQSNLLFQDKPQKEKDQEEIKGELIVVEEEQINQQNKEQQRIDNKTSLENEIDLNQVVGKDVLNVLQNVDNVDKQIDEVLEDISQNPLEGIKNIFKRKGIEDNLTKEEKEELKERQKEQQHREKLRIDSIDRIIAFQKDSINKIEKFQRDSINSIEKQKILEEKLEQEDKLRQKRELEERRKEQLKNREKERKQKILERKQKQKEMELRRAQKQKEQEERRKQLLKEREKMIKNR